MTQIRVKTQNMAKKLRAYLKKSWILQEELDTTTYSQQEYEQEPNDLVTRDQVLQHARITVKPDPTAKICYKTTYSIHTLWYTIVT